jgi:hypothetical protein
MRLGAFAIVAEERGFSESCSRALKLITERRFFCGRGLLLSGRVIHLDGDSLILEPHSSGHHVPLPFCAYGSDPAPSAIEPLGAATWYARDPTATSASQFCCDAHALASLDLWEPLAAAPEFL